MTFTDKSYKALRRDTDGKHNVVTDMLDEIDKLRADLAHLTAELNASMTMYSVVSEQADKATADLARRDDLIKRLVEDGERLATAYSYTNCVGETTCVYCGQFADPDDHAPDCPITLHRALMKEVEG